MQFPFVSVPSFERYVENKQKRIRAAGFKCKSVSEKMEYLFAVCEFSKSGVNSFDKGHVTLGRSESKHPTQPQVGVCFD